MEQLHKDVHTYVEQLVLSKVLPAISAKWNIPMDQLTLVVKGQTAGVPTEKPTPTTKTTPKKNTGGGDLREKVADAKAQNKYYNVISGKLLNDTPANRKKYVFYKELGIAGIEGDPKTAKAMEMLSGSSGKEEITPEEPESVEEELQAEPVEQPPPMSIEELPEEENQEPAEEPIKKVAFEPEEDDVNQVVKLSEIIEEKTTENDAEQKVISRFNAKVRANVFQPFGFAYRKLTGGAIQVIGKLDSTGSKLVELNEKDIKECQRRKWVVAFT